MGKRTRKCRYCDLVANEAIKPTGHKYDRDHVEIVQATCTVGGYRKYTCTVCGDKKIEYFSDPLGHDWGEWTVAKAATCTEDGERYRTCSVCGRKETKKEEKLGHEHARNDKPTVVEPTCTAKGYTE